MPYQPLKRHHHQLIAAALTVVAVLSYEQLPNVWPSLSKLSWYALISLVWATYLVALGVQRTRKGHTTENGEPEDIDDTTTPIALIDDEEANEGFEHTGTLDTQTHTYTRRGLTERLDELKSDIHTSHKHALILADIDHFTSLNQELAQHAVKCIANIFVRRTRSYDIVCRWGEDSFVVICVNCTPENAFIVAEKIRQEIATLCLCSEAGFRATVSVGVTNFNADEDLGEALKQAKYALLMAKKEGRNRSKLWVNLEAPANSHLAQQG